MKKKPIVLWQPCGYCRCKTFYIEKIQNKEETLFYHEPLFAMHPDIYDFTCTHCGVKYKMNSKNFFIKPL